MNAKTTSHKVAALAAQVLASGESSQRQRRLAGSALSQAAGGRQTGADMETIASKALDNPRSAPTTKVLAASVLAQANKKR